jgi:hypothetical protein
MRQPDKRFCVDCDEPYTLTPNKPGRINQCGTCGSKAEVPKVKGVTTYAENGDVQEITIVSEAQHAEMKRLRASSALYKGW